MRPFCPGGSVGGFFSLLAGEGPQISISGTGLLSVGDGRCRSPKIGDGVFLQFSGFFWQLLGFFFCAQVFFGNTKVFFCNAKVFFATRKVFLATQKAFFDNLQGFFGQPCI